LLVAIVGGSGSGKTWLAEKIQALLGPECARLSLDDFYLDRSHLPPQRRETLNFDRPQAIDWRLLEQALANVLRGRPTRVPAYDFRTHTRLPRHGILRPAPIILVEGLWLLRRPSVRRLFEFKIFLECPMRTRLHRRVQRDLLTRARNRLSVSRQFRRTVEPMHGRFVAPQIRRADLVLSTTRSIDVKTIASFLEERLAARRREAGKAPGARHLCRFNVDNTSVSDCLLVMRA
jgi:uridine kinase